MNYINLPCSYLGFCFIYRYPIDSEDRCVGESFKPCKEEDPKSMCVGRAFRVYFYEFKKQPGKQVSHQGIASGGGYGIFSPYCVSLRDAVVSKS